METGNRDKQYSLQRNKRLQRSLPSIVYTVAYILEPGIRLRKARERGCCRMVYSAQHGLGDVIWLALSGRSCQYQRGTLEKSIKSEEEGDLVVAIVVSVLTTQGSASNLFGMCCCTVLYMNMWSWAPRCVSIEMQMKSFKVLLCNSFHVADFFINSPRLGVIGRPSSYFASHHVSFLMYTYIFYHIHLFIYLSKWKSHEWRILQYRSLFNHKIFEF